MSQRLRRISTAAALGLVGLMAIAGPVSSAVNAETSPVVTVNSVPAAAVTDAAPVVTTTEAAVVVEVAEAAPVAAPTPVVVAAPTTTAAPAVVDVPVEIGTACVIEADGTSTGCE